MFMLLQQVRLDRSFAVIWCRDYLPIRHVLVKIHVLKRACVLLNCPRHFLSVCVKCGANRGCKRILLIKALLFGLSMLYRSASSCIRLMLGTAKLGWHAALHVISMKAWNPHRYEYKQTHTRCCHMYHSLSPQLHCKACPWGPGDTPALHISSLRVCDLRRNYTQRQWYTSKPHVNVPRSRFIPE